MPDYVPAGKAPISVIVYVKIDEAPDGAKIGRKGFADTESDIDLSLRQAGLGLIRDD